MSAVLRVNLKIMSDILSESGQKHFVALKAVVSYMWNLPASQRQVMIDCFCAVVISSMDIHHCNELRVKFIDLFIIVREIFCYRNRDLHFLYHLLFLLFSFRSYFYQLLLYILLLSTLPFHISIVVRLLGSFLEPSSLLNTTTLFSCPCLCITIVSVLDPVRISKLFKLSTWFIKKIILYLFMT